MMTKLSPLEKWLARHKETIEMMIVDLDLPLELVEIVYDLWRGCRIKAARTPNSLIVDCVYVAAFMTGNRRSIATMKGASLRIINRATQPCSHDRRMKDKTRWIQTDWGKKKILDIFVDEDSYDELIGR